MCVCVDVYLCDDVEHSLHLHLSGKAIDFHRERRGPMGGCFGWAREGEREKEREIREG